MIPPQPARPSPHSTAAGAPPSQGAPRGIYGGNNGVLPTWKILFANLVLATVAAVALGAAIRLRRPAR